MRLNSLSLLLIHGRLFLLLGFLFGVQSAVFAQESYRFSRLWPQLQQPWYFNKPSSLAFGTENEFYVTDTGNHRIQVFNEDGSFLRSFGSFGASSGQFNEPTGIALNDAEVFVADSRNHRIQVYNKNSGNFLRAWGKQGSQAGEFNLPFGLAIDAKGRVFCVDSLNHRVQVFDTSGTLLSQWGEQGTASGQFYTPQGIAISSTGDVLVVDSGNHRIQVFDSSGKFLRLWGGKGSVNGKFTRPYGISITKAGQVMVADTLNHRIQIFDTEGHFLSALGKQGAEQGQFYSPYAVAETTNGNIIVVDTSNHRLQVFNNKGEYLHNWSSFSATQGEFKGPYHAAINANQQLFVADMLNHRIQVFNPDGSYLRSWGKQGSEHAEFQWPSAVAFNAAGEVFVVDSGNHRIQVFDSYGKYLRSWGGFGSTKGKFYYPKSLAVSADGKILVTDSSNYRIQVFNAAGEFLLAWGSAGKTEGRFESPYGIAVSPQGEVFVTDPWNYRIQVFTLEGKFLRTWGSYGNNPGQLNRPYNIATDAKGLVYVSDTYNHRIQVFNVQGQYVDQLGEFGSSAGQLNFPSAVALDAQNNVLVVDQNNNRIQVFNRSAPNNNTPHPFKAIVLAGGGPSQGNYVNHIWDATQLLANKAYAALRGQGFAKTEVKYLSAGNTQIDLDNNTLFDDIETATAASLEQAITLWAQDAQDVVVYLIDHGGEGRFQINDHEILTAAQLNTWMDQLESKLSGRVTLVIESCRSGSFLSAMLRPKRQVIASADAQQAAIVGNKGLNSFSYYFWSEIRSGAVLQDAFRTARQGMSSQIVENRPQNALLDSNGDGIFAKADYDVLGDYCLGNCSQYAANFPTISRVTPNTTLQGENKLQLQASINSLEAINSAWIVILPPDFKHPDTDLPVSDLPKVYLQCDTQGKCTGSYEQFNLPGNYTLSFYAMDAKYQLSLPEQRTVTQKGGTPTAPVTIASYQPDTQLLQLSDVLVGTFHYSMQLQNSGDFVFVITQMQQLAIGQTGNVVATFDSAHNILDIPELQVADKKYSVKLKYLGDFKLSAN